VRQHLVIVVAIALLAAAGGYWVARSLNPPGPAELQSGAARSGDGRAAPEPAALIGQPRPDFELADATGRTLSAASFDGKALLLNFWASWCQPCVEEMPMLSQLHQDLAGQDFAIIGVALDDPERAREFAEELSVAYPLLFGRADAMLVGRRYGNRAGLLPYSVLVDAEGIIRWTRLGALERSEVEAQLAALR
jgi:peroxiredoxin